MRRQSFHVAEGEGIGPEVMHALLPVLDGIGFTRQPIPGVDDRYRRTGVVMTGDAGAAAKRAEHEFFQPCYEAAPEPPGEGIANPVAIIPSATVMLDWRGVRHPSERYTEDAQQIEAAFGSGTIRPLMWAFATVREQSCAAIEHLGSEV